MSDLSDERLVGILDGEELDLHEVAERMVVEIRRRRQAHQEMLLEVGDLRRYVEMGDSRHPYTIDAVRRMLDALRKADG